MASFTLFWELYFYWLSVFGAAVGVDVVTFFLSSFFFLFFLSFLPQSSTVSDFYIKFWVLTSSVGLISFLPSTLISVFALISGFGFKVITCFFYGDFFSVFSFNLAIFYLSSYIFCSVADTAAAVIFLGGVASFFGYLVSTFLFSTAFAGCSLLLSWEPFACLLRSAILFFSNLITFLSLFFGFYACYFLLLSIYFWSDSCFSLPSLSLLSFEDSLLSSLWLRECGGYTFFLTAALLSFLAFGSTFLIGILIDLSVIASDFC